MFLAAIFVAEVLAASIWLDTSTLVRVSGLTGIVGDWGPPVLRSLMAASAIFVTFGYLNCAPAFQRISALLVKTSIQWTLLASHFVLMAAFAGLSSPVFGSKLSGLRADTIMGIWLLVGLSAIPLAAFAFMPPRLWLGLVRGTGALWAYASAAGVLAWLAGSLNRPLWKISTAMTFGVVKTLLHPFLSRVIADPVTRSIGSPGFHVEIDPQCSGMEGAGLMLIFGVLWLWYFRKESRFPQALLLIPAGVSVLWLLNALRIAALILIGNAGAPAVALGGFHSQAGWMAFIVVALGFSIGVQRMPWISTRQPGPASSADANRNPAAPYLMPFLMILAAAMISRSLAGGFERLYPLRFLAAGAALWFFRRRYAGLNWTFGWIGPVVGVIVAGIWLSLDLVAGVRTDSPIAPGLASLTAPARFIWIAFRTLAAVVTVPIAEELAFRGFLIRRLMSADFESLSVRKFSYVALLLSSVLFGLLHGDRWLAGIVAGLLYAFAFLFRGKIGDAVIAHATTNALLAALVLFTGRWYLW
jgi:exosortase E/protease (VPEID-CTERM system)